jgi:hypothetical protein
MILTKKEYTLFTNYYIHKRVQYKLSETLKFPYHMNYFELVCTYILDTTIK